MRLRSRAVAATALGALALIGCGEPREQRALGGERPNIIVVMTDDQGPQTLEPGLPEATRRLSEEGTRMERAYVTTPLCCPSRASFLSGQYGHNNGVLANDPGYPSLRRPRDVLPTWLGRAGYRTSMIGKFLNGYDRTPRGAGGRPAPGWEQWDVMERTYAYYGYSLRQDERLVAYGDDEDDYLTDVLTERALDRIGELEDDPRPLFMWLSYWAPHKEGSESTDGKCAGQAIPRSRDTRLHPDAMLPGDRRSINEADATDKPAYIATKRSFRPRDRRRALLSHRCALGSLEAVDRGVVRILERLAELGELKRTAIILTSDNGFMFGEHRLVDGKSVPYEESIRVPAIVDLPPELGPQPRRIGALVANIDLAPTIAELAGARPCLGGMVCRRIDGRSWVGALRGRERLPRGRAILLEADQGRPCPFRGIRTDRYLFARYIPTGEAPCLAAERELYDTDRDPAQLDNLLATDPGGRTERLAARLERRMERLEDS